MQHANATPVSVTNTKRQRRWSDHPTVRFLGVVGVLLGLYAAYGYVTGPWRITDRLQARLEQKPATVDIRVTAKFPPEVFHIRIYQQVGSMRGVEGMTATLYAVTPANVRFLSRYYWIREIDLVPTLKQSARTSRSLPPKTSNG